MNELRFLFSLCELFCLHPSIVVRILNCVKDWSFLCCLWLRVIRVGTYSLLIDQPFPKLILLQTCFYRSVYVNISSPSRVALVKWKNGVNKKGKMRRSFKKKLRTMQKVRKQMKILLFPSSLLTIFTNALWVYGIQLCCTLLTENLDKNLLIGS